MSDPLGPSEVPSHEEIEATVAEAVYRMGGELDPTITIRFVAGLSFDPALEGGAYSIYALLERDGDKQQRVGDPQPVIQKMNKEQAEHLHMQLGRVLGKEEAS